jgi:biopolymer transport protein ExbD
MLDVVFILLIFFLVTASFVRDSVVDISRPDAAASLRPRDTTLVVSIGPDDRFWIDDRHIDMRRLGARVAQFLAERPDGSVAIHASTNSSNGALVTVIDQARLSGASSVSIVETSGDS